jgi:quercetin dioxygenase-like cupin family protein
MSNTAIPDTTVTKVTSGHSPPGAMGQRYLAAGKRLSMRLWKEEEPGREDSPHARDYETVGYVLSGRAELHLGEQMVLLQPGDCWVVPSGAEHFYRILERFSAVEATSPPASVHARDES